MPALSDEPMHIDISTTTIDHDEYVKCPKPPQFHIIIFKRARMVYWLV
jgi:hypothetical protein